MANIREAVRAAMQATANIKPRSAGVPEWGDLYVRAITVAEVEEQTADTDAKGDKFRFARAAARVLCDADGNLLFDAKEPEDVNLLSRQPWTLLQKVLAASGEFNATSDEGVAEAKNG